MQSFVIPKDKKDEKRIKTVRTPTANKSKSFHFFWISAYLLQIQGNDYL